MMSMRGPIGAMHRRSCARGIALTGAIGLWTATAAAQPCQPTWSTEFTAGPDDGVYALHQTDERLYVGGEFVEAAGVVAHRIAAYERGAWSSLDPGFTHGHCQFDPPSVFSLLEVDLPGVTGLIAGGRIGDAAGMTTSAIARWHNNTWHAMGEGLILSCLDCCGAVTDMAVFDDGRGPSLFVAGPFDLPAWSIARWSGTGWEEVGGPIVAEYPNSLQVHDDGTGPALYIGGGFQIVGPIMVRNIARWDGQWRPVGDGHEMAVTDLIEFDEGPRKVLLVATGDHGEPGEVWRWDGDSWSRLGEPFDTAISALTVFDDGSGPAPYAGGAFTTNGGRTVRGLAKWNGDDWIEVGGGVTLGLFDGVFALEPAVDQGVWTLLVGGSFSTVGAGVPAQNIARLVGCALACYPDCDGSGGLDVFDFLCFQDAFVVADPYADCDGNSVFDVFDFLCFQDAFVTGCR